MDITAVISSNLTELMNSTPGMDTLKKISAKSHVGFGTVQRAKNGDGNITVQNLTAIAEAFGRHPAALLIDKKDTPLPEGVDAVIYEPGGTVSFLQVKDAASASARTKRQERIDTINQLITSIDDYGLVALLEKAKDIANDYPGDVSKTAL